MFSRLMPHEGKFFDLFKELAELIVQGSRELQALMATFEDVERRRFNIETIEKKGDKVTHTTVGLAHLCSRLSASSRFFFHGLPMADGPQKQRICQAAGPARERQIPTLELLG